LSPSDVSRDEVQVVLRASTSTSPDCKAVKRSLADNGTYLTFSGSFNTAAATALQKSTSRPVHFPCASGSPKPVSVLLATQLSIPVSFTALSVWADVPCAATTRLRARTVANRFMWRSSKAWLDLTAMRVLQTSRRRSPGGNQCPFLAFPSRSPHLLASQNDRRARSRG